MAVKEEQKAAPAKGDKKGKQPQENKDDDLSDEDLELKRNLELMVERVQDADAGVQKLALESIVKEIHTATSSMTSVPKPLKFLRAHLDTLKARFEQLPDGENKKLLADIISVLCTTTVAKEGEREGLRYKLMGITDDLGRWGHEYLRHLAGEIAEEFKVRRDEEQPVDDMMHLITQIVPFHMTHNAEPEAVDLLLETDRLDLLEQHVDKNNYNRTCLYLVSCCSYLPEPDDMVVLEIAHRIYSKLGKFHDALRVALRMNRREVIESTFASCSSDLEKKQLGYLLARHGVALNLEEGPAAVMDDDVRESLREIISNSKLSEHFLTLARDLDVLEPKVPEDVYKTHLTGTALLPAATASMTPMGCSASFGSSISIEVHTAKHLQS